MDKGITFFGSFISPATYPTRSHPIKEKSTNMSAATTLPIGPSVALACADSDNLVKSPFTMIRPMTANRRSPPILVDEENLL